MERFYAHSVPSVSQAQWEPLAHHLNGVGDLAGRFAGAFGCRAAARVAGLLHDIGKCSAAYQDYIRQAPKASRRGPDHSTAGAREAVSAYGRDLGRMLAFAIAGHHAGLADFADLTGRLDGKTLEPYDGWRDHVGDLPGKAALIPTARITPSRHRGFTYAFLTRMLFSCLVDADFLETERFYAQAAGEFIARGGHADLGVLRERLSAHMAKVQAGARESNLNRLRAEVLGHARSKAALDPGLFSLTVPTGGGKTLASLSFALDHAVTHGLARVIYVIPYTSIIEQTAEVFRHALGTRDDILEHHASFDWGRAGTVEGADSEGPAGLVKLRKAAENWDVPIVVTTAVQFFESLHARRTSACRKLHNITNSVVILDEAQMLPLHLLRPCMAALDELARNYRTSVVLCTATQPALSRQQGFADPEGHKGAPQKIGFDIPEERELAPRPRDLYAALKRVSIETLREPVDDATIAERFAQQPQMLCIVNSRAHARALFERIRGAEGAAHLTTMMCPRHRRAILSELRQRLMTGLPVRLVATSLIEAGVDISFPEVWRAETGLDSIAQAAGRCNREGALPGLGRTVVFTPAEVKPPHSMKAAQQSARTVLRTHPDPLTLEAVHAYFTELYWQRGAEAMDAATLDGETWPILRSLEERGADLTFEFEKIARAFRMIDDVMEPVIVPWDADVVEVLERIEMMERPLAGDLRRLQQYVVTIPSRARADWLARGALRAVHPQLGNALVRFEDLSHYRAETGVELVDSVSRASELNVL
ncbi:CRISPR-associated endonuclease Cas3'' [Zavarzinia sp. CC-PAN008]|uniref:CRISPR-associated endonuclease Cas3'' n=1 Tax=Zavarzinia sp. CC-PAN008 TaxID=3243332 RepID=UPI003F746BA4